MKFSWNGEAFPQWMRGRIKKFRITTSIFRSTVEVEFYPTEQNGGEP